jgi:DNA-binding GntR family transcriptional regulator
MNDAIIRQPVRTAVRERVIQRIVDGLLPAGGAINLASLAAELAVSATPLREALIELERDGFVGSSPGRGFFVRPFESGEVQQIYPLIWTLEALALRSTPAPDGRKLRRLQDINAELKAEAGNPARALQLDTQWHDALLEGCPNELLLELLKGLKQRAQRYEFAFMKESGESISIQQHTSVLRALKANDLTGAAQLLEENWQIGPRFLVPWLEARSANAHAPTRAMTAKH